MGQGLVEGQMRTGRDGKGVLIPDPGDEVKHSLLPRVLQRNGSLALSLSHRQAQVRIAMVHLMDCHEFRALISRNEGKE